MGTYPDLRLPALRESRTYTTTGHSTYRRHEPRSRSIATLSRPATGNAPGRLCMSMRAVPPATSTPARHHRAMSPSPPPTVRTRPPGPPLPHPCRLDRLQVRIRTLQWRARQVGCITAAVRELGVPVGCTLMLLLAVVGMATVTQSPGAGSRCAGPPLKRRSTAGVAVIRRSKPVLIMATRRLRPQSTSFTRLRPAADRRSLHLRDDHKNSNHREFLVVVSRVAVDVRRSAGDGRGGAIRLRVRRDENVNLPSIVAVAIYSRRDRDY